MISVKKQKLLNIAFACVDPGECYVEVGTYTGKSLISAMLNNEPSTVYACDNFSEFQETNSLSVLRQNLEHYELSEGVTFYNGDFNEQIHVANISEPIGVYFFDGPHDEESQYQGVRVPEDLLADEALVIVDDWRLATDSASYAKVGTERAVRDSTNTWERMYELPARFNGTTHCGGTVWTCTRSGERSSNGVRIECGV